MNSLTTEIFGNVPARPSLVLPARVDMAVVRELERVLGGREHVAWMVESSLRPAAELMQYLQESRSTGFFTAIASSGVEPVVQQIHRMLESGRHVVFLCSGAEQAGSVADVPVSFLRYFDSSSLAAVPVGVSMFNADVVAPMVTEGAYSSLLLHFMPEEAAGPSLAARVLSAWQEASAMALSVHPLVEHASVAEGLLYSLLKHPHAEIMDGVDDSHMSYRRAMVYALILSKRLRHYTAGKRLGVILPPGKLSVIANLACLFAGIAPLNIDYHSTAESFAHLCRESGVERFIASEAFIHKRNDFAWPSQRDIIFIDKELLAIGSSHLRFWELMCSWPSKHHVASRAGVQQADPDSEVLLSFAPSTEDKPRLISYTHKALMAAVVQMQSRIKMQAGESALYVQPLYSSETLVPEFLLPILLGLNLVTYPSPKAEVRINTMIRQYRVAHVTLQPENVQRLFANASSEQFSSVRQFLLVGGMVPESLVREALTSFRLPLCECRSIPEFAAPLTMVVHDSTQAVDSVPESQQQRFAGNIGVLLPGTVVRVMDLAEKNMSIAPDSPGIIRYAGPTLVHSLLNTEDKAAACYTASYLGRVNEKGELIIMGATDAFSKVRGELVAHAYAEAALCRVLKVNPQDSVRRIALIGMPDPSTGGHMLVLLSTVHKKVIPNDTVALHYGLLNMKLSPQWAPKLILAVPAIPVLPDGSVNYEFCRAGIRSVLKAGK